MRRLPVPLPTLVLAAFVSDGGSGAHDDAVVEAQRSRFEAMRGHDVSALEELLHDDLVYTHGNGQTETKAQFLETLRSGRLRYDSIAPRDVSVRRYGSTAVATGAAAMQVRAEDTTRSFTVRFVEVHVLAGGRWRMVAWQSTRTQ